MDTTQHFARNTGCLAEFKQDSETFLECVQKLTVEKVIEASDKESDLDIKWMIE